MQPFVEKGVKIINYTSQDSLNQSEIDFLTVVKQTSSRRLVTQTRVMRLMTQTRVMTVTTFHN